MGNSEGSLYFGNISVDRTQSKVHEDWTILPGKLNDVPLNVFVASHPTSSKKRPLIEKCLQASKVYRHPGILRFVEGGIVMGDVVVVTEEATPLLNYGFDNFSPLQITAGVASIMETLAFLHDKAGVSHNNVGVSSIYVTSEGAWKLWGFEYLCSFGELTCDHIERINQYCSAKTLPPEDKTNISPAYQHARDAFTFAKFVDEFVTPHVNEVPLFSSFLSHLHSKSFSPMWEERPRFLPLLQHPVFQHDFLQLKQSIGNLILLSANDRDAFFIDLVPKLHSYPEDLVASTLSASLLCRSVLIIPAAAQHLMPYMLTPNNGDATNIGLFSPSIWSEFVCPHVLHLFEVHDAAVRCCLLKHFKHYMHYICKVTLQKEVLPEILLGIRDTDEQLVSLTLESLALLVPLLGANVVIGKNRHTIFAKSKPKITSTSRDKFKMRNKSNLIPISTDPSSSDSKLDYTPSTRSTLHLDLSKSQSEDALGRNLHERSSPDGGESLETPRLVSTTDEEEKFPVLGKEINASAMQERSNNGLPSKKVNDHIAQIASAITKPDNISNPFSSSDDLETDVWSDWEDESASNKSPVSTNVELSNVEAKSYLKEEKNKMESRRAMQLNVTHQRSESRSLTSQGLGEEYDIMSISVKKLPDTELQLFADLEPKILPSVFDLETMLQEAHRKVSNAETFIEKSDILEQHSATTDTAKLPSISETLAALDMSNATQQGDETAWGDDSVWSD